MKTSLASSAALAALSKPATVKADQPQQLKSVTIYWRGRKMVLMQRPQRRLSALLCKMLRRSWANLFGSLTRIIGAGAMATAALGAQAAGLPANTLPSGYSLQSGAAREWQHHNHLTIKQTSEDAAFDWQSFSIGSNASVRFIQNDANAVALNRVTGNDPSIIMGSLTANGKIFLINAAGILVGKTGKIDVASFTASTLNITDADAFAGNMNFAADVGKTIGNVKNKGAITSADGGSVYLVGANVENDGIITSPNGQVLLAAGNSVQFVDTSLPGVTINVGGVDGKVTNLGQIIASAGTIGIGAGLIDNSGIINASSVDKEGGRIFLRAATHLTTGDSSEIDANGTTGGNIQLYSDGITEIRGNVSALGSAGNGGYVDTSGMAGLTVHYVPKLGAGGQWMIDPYDIEISHGDDVNGGVLLPFIDDAIASVSGYAEINDGTINAQLNQGTSVTVATGASILNGTNGGRITLDSNAAITKSSGGAATLTMTAATDIDIGGTISDGSTAANNHGLGLALTAGSNVNITGNITLAGNLTSHAAAFTVASGSTVNLYGASNSFNNNFQMTGGTVNVNGATVFQNASVGQNAILNLNAATTINDTTTVSNGTLNVNAPTTTTNLTVNASSSSTVNLSANLTTSQLNLQNGLIEATAPSTFTVNHSFTQTNGSMNLQTASITQTNGDLQIGAGGITADNLTLTATNGAITQTGAITGGGTVNAIATQGITLTDTSNSVASFGASTTSGNVELNTHGGLVALGAVSTGSGDITIQDVDNDIRLNGAVSATGTVTLTAAAGIVQEAGSITANSLNVAAPDDIDLQSSTNHVTNFAANSTGGGHIKFVDNGNLTLGAINDTNSEPDNGGVDITTTGGAISQGSGDPAITVALLNLTADNGITLNSSANVIGTFIAQNNLGGDISLINDGSDLLTLGRISNASNTGNITISSSNGIQARDVISARGIVSLTAGGDLTTQNSVTGSAVNLTTLTIGDISVQDQVTASGTNGSNGTITLASAASINENNADGTPVGSLAGGALNTSAAGDIDLHSSSNQVASFSASSTSGGIKLNDAGNLVLGAISATGTGEDNSGSVTLTTTGGTITQSAGISATTLNVTADNGITVNGNSNAIGTFSASNLVSGDISLKNSGSQLLTLGSISNDSATGAITVNSTVSGISTTGWGDGAGDIIAQGAVTLIAGGDLTVKDNITGQDINLTTRLNGNMSIQSQLTTTGGSRPDFGTTTLVSAGAITESDTEGYSLGGITGGTLNASAATGIFLGNSDQQNYNSVTLFTANSTNGDIQFNNFGDLTLGAISAPGGAVTIATAGNMTVNSSGISSQGTIALTTTAPDQFQTEGLNNGGDDGGDDDAPAQVLATLSIGGNLTSDNGSVSLYSAAGINQTGGKITASSGGVTLDASGDLTVGGQGIAAQTISLTTHPVEASKGDDDQLIPPFNPTIDIEAQMTGTSSVVLQSAGLITQNISASAGITTASLDAHAFAGITLNSTGNSVAAFTAANSQEGDTLSTGDIALTDASTVLALNGNIRNDALLGNVMITNNGVAGHGGDIVSTAAHVEGGVLSGINGIAASSGTVSLTSTNGNVTLGGIGATNLNVSAAGWINQEDTDLSGHGTGGLNITNTMTALASNGITLNHSFGSCGTNHIANFSGNNSASGDITLINSGNTNLLTTNNTGRGISININEGTLTTAGTITGANILLATNSDDADHPGNIIINSQLNGSTSVTLNGGVVGSITEGASGGISSALLTATGSNGITLDSANNTVNGFAATDGHNASEPMASISGNITLINNSNVTASHTLTTQAVHAETGNISIENTGAMVTTSLIDAPAGTVTLRTHSPLTIGAGGVSAGGNVSLTAGNPGANSSTSDNLVINGAVASGGNLALAAGNHLTVNALVTAVGSANISTGGGFTFSPGDPLPPNLNIIVTAAPDTPPPPPPNTPVIPPTTTNSTVDQSVASTTNNVNNNTDNVIPGTPTNSTNTAANSDQTVGGGTGEFGGSDTSDDKKTGTTKSSKPLPLCT